MKFDALRDDLLSTMKAELNATATSIFKELRDVKQDFLTFADRSRGKSVFPGAMQQSKINRPPPSSQRKQTSTSSIAETHAQTPETAQQHDNAPQTVTYAIGGEQMDFTSDGYGLDPDTETEFSVVTSRRKKRKMTSASPLQNTRTEQHSNNSYATAASQPARAVPDKSNRQAATQPPKRRTLVGESTTCSLKAASSLQVKKKEYKLLNIDSVYSPEDVQSYLESLGIRVVYCSLLQPRPRQPECNSNFRICIFATDMHKLLVKGAWSSGVVVQEWVYRPKT